MENEVQPSLQSAQPLSQITPIKLPCNNLLKILSFILFGVTVILGSVLIGMRIEKNQARSKQVNTVLPKTLPVQSGSLTLTGVIRTSGLSDDEKQRLGLFGVSYQITDLSKKDKEDLDGYYLLPSDQKLETFLGKCVHVIGTEPTEWLSRDKTDSYQRSTLVLNSINQIDGAECSPSLATSVGNNSGAKKLTLQGIVENSTRPAPDIYYDYQVKLAKPLLDEYNASGLPQEVSRIIVIPESKDLWVKLMDSVNLEVEIQGYMEWGYAESKYFKLTELTIL